MRLGVALAWHVHPWEELLALVQRAEALGYATVTVDGDVSMLDRRRNADVLDGWTVTTALLAHTRSIEISSMRLVHHWNPARLAQAMATADRLAPGRLRFLISIGDRATDARFGLPGHSAMERVEWLDETLTVLRRLWLGDTVTFEGRYVRLDRARVRPIPDEGRLPIAIAARRPRMLDLVAKHADVWDLSLPPVAERVERAAAELEAACERHERFPEAITRSMLIFTRVGESGEDAEKGALSAFRRLNPWFAKIPDEEIGPSLVVGDAEQCERRLAEIARDLRLELPIVDLSGLESGPALAALEALAPNRRVDAGT